MLPTLASILCDPVICEHPLDIIQGISSCSCNYYVYYHSRRYLIFFNATELQIRGGYLDIFLYKNMLWVSKYLTEALLISTHMFSWRNKKIVKFSGWKICLIWTYDTNLSLNSVCPELQCYHLHVLSVTNQLVLGSPLQPCWPVMYKEEKWDRISSVYHHTYHIQL